MMPEQVSNAPADITDVFISYAEPDKEFARKLDGALREHNYSVWIDWADTPSGEDFGEGIARRLEAANNIIVVLSPAWVISPQCQTTIEFVLPLNKRFIPVVWRDVNPAEIPFGLGTLKPIYFRPEDGFDRALAELFTAIDDDSDYINFHTRLLLQALQWSANGYDAHYLLRDEALQTALPWLDQSEAHSPPLLELQTEYIMRSQELSETIAPDSAATEMFELATNLPFQGQTGISSIAFSPDGQIIVSGSDDTTLRLWDRQGNAIGEPFVGHNEHVYGVAFSPDGQTILSGGYDFSLRLWNLNGQQIREIFADRDGYVVSLAFSRDGKTIVSGHATGTMQLWDLQGNPLRERWQAHQGDVFGIAVSPNGRTFASGGSDGTIRIWDWQGNPIGVPWQRDNARIMAIAVSPDGDILVSGDDHGILQMWEHGPFIEKLLSPATRTFGGSPEENQPGNPLGKPLLGHTDLITAIAFSPDGKTIVSASNDKTMRLWDRQGNPIGEPLQAHTLDVKAVAFSPDGKTVVSGGSDGMRLWNLYKTQITLISQRLQNDLAKGQDCLNIETELQALADILSMRDVEPPLAVGILGGWGSGKSFAMHLIQQRLNELRSRKLTREQAWEGTSNPYVGHIYQVRFDAWTYAKADLWSSLMQTIFSEFNRQLTLEKQIATAIARATLVNTTPPKATTNQSFWQRLRQWLVREPVTPTSPPLPDINPLRQQAQLDGGMFWQALNDMNDSDRALMLETNLSPLAWDRLKVGQSQQELTDYLWKQLGELRQNEKTELVEKTKALQQEKRLLRRLILLRTPLYFLQKNWLILVAFLIGAAIATYPWLPQDIKDRLPKDLDAVLSRMPGVTALSGLGSAFLTGRSLWEKTRAEQEKILADLKKHQTFVQTQLNATKELKTTAHQEVLQSDIIIKQKVAAIQQLEAQIGQQQQQIGLSSAFPTLDDFISDRLQNDSYSKQLGFLQQVQRDLADLTNHFTFPNQSDTSKTQFKERLEKLQQIFPRGPARIILYIDDLDRCPPEQVVSVLEAVQLILKTPLFIVVLAIDDRYIARALEKVYAGVLTRQGHPSGIDYLEKIIQLPYRMRPISPEGLEKYLQAQIELEGLEAIAKPQVEQQASFMQQTQVSQSFRLPELTLPTGDSAPENNQPESDEIVAINDPAIAPATNPEPEPQRAELRDLVTENQPDQRPTKTSTNPSQAEAKTPSPLTDTPAMLTEDICQSTKFTQFEFHLIKDCCQHVDITPRTAKRLINTFKILKIIWSNATEPSLEIKQIIVSFLALSGRYPDFMRHAFIEIDTCFEQASYEYGGQSIANILQGLEKPFPDTDKYANREWKRFQHDIQQMLPPYLSLAELGRSTFNLILSFCFVGDIGYDPNDFSATAKVTADNIPVNGFYS